MSAWRMAGCLAAAAGLLAGCQGSSGDAVEPTGGAYREVTPPPELVAQARPPIPDLPVPVGFDLDEERSRNLAVAGLRWVDHLYKGKRDRFAVARFYKRQMPIERWTLVKDMFAQGSIELDFVKESERCEVTCRKGDLWHPTYIKIEVWTAGRVPIQEPSAPRSPRRP